MFYIRIVFTLFVLLVTSTNSNAQENYCAHDLIPHLTKFQKSSNVDIPTEGEFKMLIVFVQFKNDTNTGSSTCRRSLTEWPTGPGVTLPQVAPRIISPISNPATFPDSSLSYFFYRISNENLIMYGDYVGYKTAHNSDHYTVPGSDKTLLEGVLSKEILDFIQNNSSISLSDYDANSDGYIDHIAIILRDRLDVEIIGDPATSGISILCDDNDSNYPPLQSLEDGDTYGIRGDLKKIDCDYSGSINIQPPPSTPLEELSIF